MGKNKDWQEVIALEHLGIVALAMGMTFGRNVPGETMSTFNEFVVSERDRLIKEMEAIIEGEKEKSRKEALEEVKKKFGGGVVIGIGDNDLGMKVPEIRMPEIDVWVEEGLDKLSNKDNERLEKRVRE